MNEEKGKWFYTAETAKPKDRSQIVSIKTGIQQVDQCIIGLNKEELSILSGTRAAGKSTILTQMALQVVQEGKRVALFSGEMNESRVFEWTYLLAAGRTYTLATDYENYFKVMQNVVTPIKQWLGQKMFVYNNNYGNQLDVVLGMLKDCVERKGVDVIILDNLMSLDIGSDDYKQNAKQTDFIWKLKAFAQENNIHVIIVCHPRKTINGIITIDDILGSSNLTNAVDNVFLLHRVNDDFKRKAMIMFRWPETHPLLRCSNIFEIAKNRDLGVMDKMVDLYFDKASKQMSCDGKEIKYGWRDDR